MEIQIRDDRKYEKALKVLYGMGGFFWSRPSHVLDVGPAQLRALAAAGVVSTNGKKSRAKKKKTLQS